MAKKRVESEIAQSTVPAPVAIPVPPPTIHAATTVAASGVQRGVQLTQAQAEAPRKNGEDVVVCGDNLAANRALAKLIEGNANGQWKADFPHPNAGPNALPHIQPDPRPPDGHPFYETPNRKAIS